MKTKLHSPMLRLLILVAFLSTNACSGTQKAVGDSNAANRTLIDYLRRDPAVRVVGNTENASIYVNNIQGVTGGGKGQPVFILNGQPIGYTYNEAVQLVNGKTIESVKVLKSTVATVQYGEPGSNGAVVIRTKESN